MSTVSSMITRIRRRLEDPTALHWPDTEVIGAVNESKSDLYQYIFNRNRDVFDTSVVEYTWPADTISVHATTINPAMDSHDILLITTTPTTESTTVNNLPFPLRRMNFEELYRHSATAPQFYDALQDELGNAESWAGGGRPPESSLRWAMQGMRVYLDPIPRSELKLRFDVISQFKEFNENGTDNSLEVFPGTESVFKRWERVIEYGATLILKGRSDENEDPLMLQLGEKRQLLNAWLDNRSVSTPRVVVDAY